MNIPLCDIKPKVIPDKKDPFGIPVRVTMDNSRTCRNCVDYAMSIGEDTMCCENCTVPKNLLGYLYDVIVRFGTTYGIVIFESGKVGRVPVKQIEVLDVPQLSIDPIKDGDEL